MFATVVIVFREVLEAALLIGIIAAATRSIPGRNRWLLAGLMAGLAGSALVAASTEAIAGMAEGIGQEIFNALVLGVAVLMLAWHNIWMSSHGKAMAAEATNIGRAIRDGQQERSILLIVVGLAVLREGSETVLFLYAVSASEASGCRRSCWEVSSALLRASQLAIPCMRVCYAFRCAGFYRNRNAGVASGRRYGIAGSSFPDPGQSASESGRSALGYIDCVARDFRARHAAS